MRRRALVFTAVGLVVVTIAACAYWWTVQSYLDWDRQTVRSITALRDRPRPEQVTADEWDELIVWTVNLHGNSATTPFSFQTKYRQDLTTLLSAETVRPEVFHAIWDVYFRATSTGRKYAESYFPASLVQTIK